MTPNEVLEFFDYDFEEDEKGMLILDNYSQPSLFYSFYDIGVNENELFKKIKEIKGDAFFCGSEVTNLGALETINGDANFCYSNISSIGHLKSIKGYAFIDDSCLVKDMVDKICKNIITSD